MKKAYFRITLMMTLFVAVLMILSALVIALPGAQGRENGMNPAATASGNIQPNPILNTNISWSTYYNGWNPLEYSNGTANLSLNAQLSSIYQNPMTINPADIQSSQFKQPLGTSGIYWNKTYTNYGSYTGSTYPQAGKISMTDTSSTTGPRENGILWNISEAYISSQNAAYDYITLIYSSTQTGTGNTNIGIGISNGTTTPGLTGSLASATNESSTTSSTATLPTNGAVFLSMEASNFVKNFDSGYMQIGIRMNLPATTTNGSISINTTIYGLMLSSDPITLGSFTNASGTHPITAMSTATGQDLTSSFAPNFVWSDITNNGYSVAVSQTMQNVTTQQSAINTASYIEQVEYQGQFNLPTAPDLSYGSANLTEHFNVSTSQTQVLDINGVSYLSTISGKNNTIQLLSTVNPNSQTQFLQIVDYTQSQWTSISSPPGIFTLAGIEYYWEEFIIAILAVVGVGAGAASRHASNLRKVK